MIGNKVYFEDCKRGEMIIAPERIITEEDILAFANLTGDRSPVHIDEVFARTTAFGGRIAHGLFILSIGSGLFLQAAPNSAFPESTVALYSISNVRFLLPAHIGDTVHVLTEVVELLEVDAQRGLIEARHCIVNQDGKTIASFRTKTLVGRRPAFRGTLA